MERISFAMRILLLLLYCVCTVVGTYEDPRDEFLTHAVVRPTMHSALNASYHPGSSQEEELTLEFEAFDKHFVIDLKVNKDLFSPKYEETYQENEKDVVIRKVNETERSCYYKGHIRNVESSWAAISTCNGFSGAVFDGKETYYIEPDRQSSTGEHFVFRASDHKTRNLKCGTDLLPDIVRPMSRKYSSDLTVESESAEQVANAANTVYSPLNGIFSVFKMKTLWIANLITTTKDYVLTVRNFLPYRKNTLLPSKRKDNSLLATGATPIKCSSYSKAALEEHFVQGCSKCLSENPEDLKSFQLT